VGTEAHRRRLRWAPKLPVAKIVRLYQADATGIRDEDLLADVAWRLRERCRSILFVTTSRVACPGCGTDFSVRPHAPATPYWRPPGPDDAPATCPACGLTVTVEEFLASIRHRDLGAPAGQCREFLERFDAAASYAERLLAIDRLVHAVHRTGGVGVRNLFEGRAKQVLTTLDELTAASDGRVSALADRVLIPPEIRRQVRALGILDHGHRLLRRHAEEFRLPEQREDAEALRANLLDRLTRVLRLQPFPDGLGLSAIQVGVRRAVAVLVSPGAEPVTLLNPVIEWTSDKLADHVETCLSSFDIREPVPRPVAAKIATVELDGGRRVISLEGRAARLALHEIDHLHGTLHADRLPSESALDPRSYPLSRSRAE
jgi:peptide deformylase